MQIRNVKGLALQIAETGQVIGPDEIVDVDAALGVALLEQPANWSSADDVLPIFPILGLAPQSLKENR